MEQVFYFGYDEKAWNRQQILTKVAIDLLGESDYKKRFQPLSELALQKMLVKRLRAERHLLMLDNFSQNFQQAYQHFADLIVLHN